jgi:uncharacterized protein YecE (DUF72 family)
MATGQAERPVLLERAEELAAIDAVIADALAGLGRFAVVEGSAGIGKSSLLGEGRLRAIDAGTVLTARGTEIERAFSYGVVRQLFERIVACWHELADKRAVLLVQLGPDLARDDARLGYFLEQLPPWIHTSVEFRHPSWTDEHVFAMLEHHTIAYCVTSGAHLPCVLRATAPFVYVRLHGRDPHHLYAGSYPIEDLRWWADRLHEWDAAGKDVFVYFNNDGHGNATPSPSANC